MTNPDPSPPSAAPTDEILVEAAILGALKSGAAVALVAQDPKHLVLQAKALAAKDEAEATCNALLSRLAALRQRAEAAEKYLPAILVYAQEIERATQSGDVKECAIRIQALIATIATERARLADREGA